MAEAIAGFDEDARDGDIIAAAVTAQAHEMILLLPAGYQTEIGRDGKSAFEVDSVSASDLRARSSAIAT